MIAFEGALTASERAIKSIVEFLVAEGDGSSPVGSIRGSIIGDNEGRALQRWPAGTGASINDGSETLSSYGHHRTASVTMRRWQFFGSRDRVVSILDVG